MALNASSARAGHLGKATVDGALVARITNWSINPTVGETAWGDSDSAGFTVRKAGRSDCTGTVSGKFDSDTKFYDTLDPNNIQGAIGEIVALTLWETQADYWHFPRVLLQNFNLAYDVDGKTVVEWSADFGADGIFYKPGAPGAPAQTAPALAT